MRAYRYETFGAPRDVLALVDVGEPHAGPGQVRVAVDAVGVNPLDWKVVGGAMAGSSAGEPVPGGATTAGSDVVGVVDEVGEGVHGVRAGARVVGYAVSGALADRAVLDVWAPVPAGLSAQAAAALPVPVETALRVLELLDLREGQTLVVDGGAGGVGIAVTQLARHRGAVVVATAGEGNHAFLQGLGALPTTYGEGLVGRVRALVPGGVDKALDAAGKGSVRDLVALVPDPHDVVTIADFGAGGLGVQVTDGDGERARRLSEAVRLAADGVVAVPVARTFPFDRAVDALEESRRGHVRGKLVVTTG